MSLHSFLTRLIWLCVLPLVLLAAYLAINRVQTIQAERDLEAANLAENFAAAIDQNLTARIGALHMLVVSPLADDASRRKEFYQEAQGFHQSFGSHVILADLEMRMLFNTRVPFGTPLPMLPRPKGHSAAPTAVETGKPAVGDTFYGPIANEPLVAIAVPAQREGKTAFLLLTILESRQFQKRLDLVALPTGWTLALLDGKDEVIARRAPPGLNPATDVDTGGRFVVKSAVSPWSVVLEIPRDIYRAPLLAAAAALAIAILGATLAGILGGMLASRRLGKSVASLAEMPAPRAPAQGITEIAAVRRLLDRSAEALRELNASLEQRVELRTAELTAANKELASFAYAVSHDLRAPLRAIDGYAQMIEEDYAGKLDEEGRRLFGVVRESSRKMALLIDDLLAFSKLGRQAIVATTVDMIVLGKEVIRELRAAGAGKSSQIVVADLPMAWGDRALLKQMWVNLLSNAFKFSGKREQPVIKVAGHHGGTENVYSVSDNGVGFDMQYYNKLFGVFQRLHSNEEFPGTGVGLAIVQRVVTRHGGRVWAEGKPNEGATFYVALPRGEEA